MALEQLLIAALGEALGTGLVRLTGGVLARKGANTAPRPAIDTTGAVRSFLASTRSLHLTEAEVTKVASTLRSFEGMSLIQNYAVAGLTSNILAYEEALKSHTRATLMCVGNLKESTADALTEPLYDVLADTLDRFYEWNRQQAGTDYAYAALSYLHNGILDQLEDTASILGRTSPAQRTRYLTFMEDYGAAAQTHLRRVRIANPSESQYVKLEDVFVPPTLAPAGEAAEDEQDAYRDPDALTDYLSTVRRNVVLGDPGAGKSTLGRWAAIRVNADASGVVFGAFIELRDYAASWKRKPKSIVSYLEEQSEVTLQVPPPEGAIEFLLRTGRSYVVFDGLDELLQVSKRVKVVDVVHAFSHQYPTVAILVTSRRVGYREAPLDDEVFFVDQLGSLSHASINEYARKWFALDSRLNADQASARAGAFLTEVEAVPDLASNPLMLSLLASLYTGVGYIPRNRADVYARCSDLLFEAWDRQRGIDAPEFTWDAKRALYHIAHWMYTSADLRSGVPRRRIQRELSNYLLARRYEDEDRADDAAASFLDLWRGRAWVLTDVGTDQRQELYQFAHQTFLEYYTARYLARAHPSPDALWAQLRERVYHQEWSVVSQLAVQILSDQRDEANDEYLVLVLDEARGQRPSSSAEADTLLAYAVGLLEGLGPKPEVVRRVSDLVLRRWVKDATEAAGLGRRDDGFSPPAAEQVLAELLACNEPLRAIVTARCVTTAVSDVLKSARGRRATSEEAEKRELLCVLASILDLMAVGTHNPRLYEQRARDIAHLNSLIDEQNGAIWKENPVVAVALVRQGVLKPEDAAESLGIAFALQSVSHPLLDVPMPSPGALIARCFIQGERDRRFTITPQLVVETAAGIRSSFESGVVLRARMHTEADIWTPPNRYMVAGKPLPDELERDAALVAVVVLLAYREARKWNFDAPDLIPTLPSAYAGLVTDAAEPSLGHLREHLSSDDIDLVAAVLTGDVQIFN